LETVLTSWNSPSSQSPAQAGFFIAAEMISQTYRHLVPDSEDYLRRLLDEYDARQVSYG
jgi:hypothetical protein